jgi:nicotinamide riboside kinase
MAQTPLDTQDDSIMKFANSVRTALSNEPGRRYMEEQVREGFQFLDDYLADVVNGTWRSQSVRLSCSGSQS